MPRRKGDQHRKMGRRKTSVEVNCKQCNIPINRPKLRNDYKPGVPLACRQCVDK